MILYSVDFTAQPTQDLKASGDGAYTVDGKTWGSGNTAQASTFDILNGTGLRIIRNAATVSPPRFEARLLNLAPSTKLFRSPVVIWTRVIHNSTGVQNTFSHSHPYNTGFGSLSHAYGRINEGATPKYQVINDGTSFTYLRTTNDTADDVHVCVIDGQLQASYYSGAWSNGWPAWSALRSRGNALWFTTTNLHSVFFNPGNSSTGSMGFGVAADEITGGAAACSLTWTHLLIEGLLN